MRADVFRTHQAAFPVATATRGIRLLFCAVGHMNPHFSLRDLSQSQRAPATGMNQSFKCGACCKPKPIQGRRLKRVLGLRQYVCAGCAK